MEKTSTKLLDPACHSKHRTLVNSFYDPNPKPRNHVESSIGLPDFMKTAEALAAPDIKGLADTAFADKARQYPMHTKEATYASAVAAFGTGLGEPMLGRIKLAARMHGIEAEVAAAEALFIQTKSAAVEPAAVPANFALQVETANGLESFYPVDGEYNLEKSARALLEDMNSGKLPIDWARQAACAIVKAAEAGGTLAYLPRRVLVLGEERLPDLEKAADLTAYRCTYLGHPPGTRELYLDVVKSAAANPEDLDTYVQLYRDIDETLHVKYSSLVPHPYEVFYGGMKLAEVTKLASQVVMVSDVMVPLDVFQRVPENEITRHFRKDACAIVKAAQGMEAAQASHLLETLDKPNQGELLNLLLKVK